MFCLFCGPFLHLNKYIKYTDKSNARYKRNNEQINAICQIKYYIWIDSPSYYTHASGCAAKRDRQKCDTPPTPAAEMGRLKRMQDFRRLSTATTITLRPVGQFIRFKASLFHNQCRVQTHTSISQHTLPMHHRGLFEFCVFSQTLYIYTYRYCMHRTLAHPPMPHTHTHTHTSSSSSHSQNISLNWKKSKRCEKRKKNGRKKRISKWNGAKRRAEKKKELQCVYNL